MTQLERERQEMERELVKLREALTQRLPRG